MWPNLGPAGKLWTCTLDMGHDGDHEARGRDGAPLLSSPSSAIPQGHEAIVVGRDERARGDEQFGGHEFRYEADTDLFRCGTCRAYEITVRADDGSIAPCKGPESGPPMRLNAF
jgi:hypothetical protein